MREHYGRGPMKAKTYAMDDIIVVVMRGSGFTPLEQTMMDSGEPNRVVAMRHDFQHMMTKRFSETPASEDPGVIDRGAHRPQRCGVRLPSTRRA